MGNRVDKILSEKFYTAVGKGHKYTEIFTDPSRKEWKQCIHGDGTCRGLVSIQHHELYIWDAFHALHYQVLDEFSGNEFDYITLEIFSENGDHISHVYVTESMTTPVKRGELTLEDIEIAIHMTPQLGNVEVQFSPAVTSGEYQADADDEMDEALRDGLRGFLNKKTHEFAPLTRDNYLHQHYAENVLGYANYGDAFTDWIRVNGVSEYEVDKVDDAVLNAIADYIDTPEVGAVLFNREMLWIDSHSTPPVQITTRDLKHLGLKRAYQKSKEQHAKLGSLRIGEDIESSLKFLGFINIETGKFLRLTSAHDTHEQFAKHTLGYKSTEDALEHGWIRAGGFASYQVAQFDDATLDAIAEHIGTSDIWARLPNRIVWIDTIKYGVGASVGVPFDDIDKMGFKRAVRKALQKQMEARQTLNNLIEGDDYYEDPDCLYGWIDAQDNFIPGAHEEILLAHDMPMGYDYAFSKGWIRVVEASFMNLFAFEVGKITPEVLERIGKFLNEHPLAYQNEIIDREASDHNDYDDEGEDHRDYVKLPSKDIEKFGIKQAYMKAKKKRLGEAVGHDNDTGLLNSITGEFVPIPDEEPDWTHHNLASSMGFDDLTTAFNEGWIRVADGNSFEVLTLTDRIISAIDEWLKYNSGNDVYIDTLKPHPQYIKIDRDKIQRLGFKRALKTEKLKDAVIFNPKKFESVDKVLSSMVQLERLKVKKLIVKPVFKPKQPGEDVEPMTPTGGSSSGWLRSVDSPDRN